MRQKKGNTVSKPGIPVRHVAELESASALRLAQARHNPGVVISITHHKSLISIITSLSHLHVLCAHNGVKICRALDMQRFLCFFQGHLGYARIWVWRGSDTHKIVPLRSYNRVVAQRHASRARNLALHQPSGTHRYEPADVVDNETPGSRSTNKETFHLSIAGPHLHLRHSRSTVFTCPLRSTNPDVSHAPRNHVRHRPCRHLDIMINMSAYLGARLGWLQGAVSAHSIGDVLVPFMGEMVLLARAVRAGGDHKFALDGRADAQRSCREVRGGVV